MSSTRSEAVTHKTFELIENAISIIIINSVKPIDHFEALDIINHELAHPPRIQPIYLAHLQNAKVDHALIDAVKTQMYSKKSYAITRVSERTKALQGLLDLQFDEAEAFAKLSSYSTNQISFLPQQVERMKKALSVLFTLTTDNHRRDYINALELMFDGTNSYGLSNIDRATFEDLFSKKALFDYTKSVMVATKLHELEDLDLVTQPNMTALAEEVEIELLNSDRNYQAFVVTQKENHRKHAFRLHQENLFPLDIHQLRGIGMAENQAHIPTKVNIAAAGTDVTWPQMILLGGLTLSAVGCIVTKGFGLFSRSRKETAKPTAAEETSLHINFCLGRRKLSD